MRKVVVERQSRLFDDVFAVDEAWVRFERLDGTMSPFLRRLKFERGDSVSALLVHRGRQTVVLVRQFRYPTHAKGPGWILETVAGIVDEGETAEEALRREILEETGYRVDEFEHVSTFYLSPGGSSERIGLYCAEVDGADRVAEGRGRASEGEDIERIEIPIARLRGLVESGGIVDAKTLVAIYWLIGRGGGP